MVHVRDILYFPEVRRRILWMVALIGVFRVGFFVPVPGVNNAAFEAGHADDPVYNWLVAASQFAAGDAGSPVLFALGLMPCLVGRIIERIAWAEAAFLAALILLPPLLLQSIGIDPFFGLWAMAMVPIAWAGLDLVEGLECIPIVPDEPPGAGQPSRLLPAPRGPSARARAYSDPGLEAT